VSVARAPAIVVVDIGKSNAKLALVDRERLAVVSLLTTANRILTDGPYPHFDVEHLWAWIRRGLRSFSAMAEIEAVSVTTHGACFALLAGDELALPVLDYEHRGPESVSAEYATVRGDFRETLSPNLPNGLNAGRQIYWLSRAFPDAFARADAILPYPQYWAWRLTGAKASEATSLGCHTDLWNPGARTYSTLVVRERWQRLFPPLVRPWDTVGTVLPAIAAETGLPPTCRVVAGIHDSNASLLPHLIQHRRPFSVLSSGTWMIVLAPGGSLDGLDADRDCLANVDAFGDPVPSARFMGGREFERMTAGTPANPSETIAAGIVADRIMAIPSFAEGTGPFRRHGLWLKENAPIDPESLSPDQRAAAASLYAALVTETCLNLAGAAGPVVVEGPFARNDLFLAALAARVSRPVLADRDATGTTRGAAMLALMPDVNVAPAHETPVAPLPLALDDYARSWRERAASA
jgi:sugar (pentulose or hexulose) kinase